MNDANRLARAVGRRRDRVQQPRLDRGDHVFRGDAELERGRRLTDADRRTGTLAHPDFRDDGRLQHDVADDRQQCASARFAGTIPLDLLRRRETTQERSAAAGVVKRALVTAHANDRIQFTQGSIRIDHERETRRYDCVLLPGLNPRISSGTDRFRSFHTEADDDGRQPGVV
ncbi:MAG TPA: hypothetical protein VGC96_14515 [Candidatus Elarobacter sp.]